MKKRKVKRAKKSVKHYQRENKKLHNQIEFLSASRNANNIRYEQRLKELTEKLNARRTLGSEQLVTQIQQAITANAHALEAIAKLAQPGIF